MSTELPQGDSSHSRLEESGPATEKVTFRDTESQLDRLETLVDTGEFPNRSEAIRAAVRQLLDERGER